MANNLSVKIGANTADLERSIERAKRTLEQYSSTAKRAKSEIENNVSVSNQQVNAYQRVVNQLEKVNSGTLATTQQQKVLTNQVKELKIQWNALTDDQRISEWGQQIASSLTAAESELETTKQKLAAVNTETNKTAKGMDNIGKSSSKTSNILGGLNGVLGKVGLAFGAAEVATTLFNGALKQSDEFGDLVTNKMAGLTNVVNSLGAALATLDFSGVMNFYSWFASGEAASQAHDNMDDTDLQLQYVYKQAQEAVTKARETGSESDKAYANKKIQELNTLTDQYRKDAINAAAADLGTALKSKKLNGVLTYQILDAAVRATPEQRKKAEKTFKQQYAELQGKAFSNSEEARWGPKSDKLLRQYAQQGGLLNIAIGALWGTGSENRHKVADDLSKADEALRMASRLTKQLNGISDVKTPDVKSPKVSTTTPVAEEKTLLQIYDDRIKKQEEELAYRQKNYEEINKRVLKERELTDELKKQGELEQINWDAVKEAAKSDVKPVSLLDTQQTMKSIEDISKEVSEKLQPELDKIPKTIKKSNDEAQEATKKQMDGVKSLAGGISSLGQIIGGTSGEVISIMGQVMGLFPGIIDAIQQMTIAEQARAYSSGTAEASKMPFPANIAAIAAIVATIASVFSSIQSFADGGIFSGASRIGDYNIARVNDGEMILNGKQQANLFRILNDNNAKVANIQYMQPEVKIKGADIYLSQKNYKNITGRKL